MINYREFKIFSETPPSSKASELFSDEIKLRDNRIEISFCDKNEANFLFIEDASLSKDSYSITCSDEKTTLFASGIRGFIFAIGMFLRKIEKDGDSIILADFPACRA